LCSGGWLFTLKLNAASLSTFAWRSTCSSLKSLTAAQMTIRSTVIAMMDRSKRVANVMLETIKQPTDN
jgi:hypothetical protein